MASETGDNERRLSGFRTAWELFRRTCGRQQGSITLLLPYPSLYPPHLFFGRFFLCEYKLCHIANMAGTWCIFTPLPLWGSVYTSCIFQCSFSFLFELTSGVCILNGVASSPTRLVHSSSRCPLCSLLNVQRVSFPSLFFFAVVFPSIVYASPIYFGTTPP